MHLLNFSVKRAHHRILRFARGMLHPFAITPARLDMLQAIHRSLEVPSQSEVARMLGVTRQTVSEMLDALESLGLVVRVDDDVDRRRTLVVLTSAAYTLLRRVHAILVRSGIANTAAARTLVDLPRAPTKVAALVGLTKEVRRVLRDFARFVPPAVGLDEHDLDRSLTPRTGPSTGASSGIAGRGSTISRPTTSCSRDGPRVRPPSPGPERSDAPPLPRARARDRRPAWRSTTAAP